MVSLSRKFSLDYDFTFCTNRRAVIIKTVVRSNLIWSIGSIHKLFRFTKTLQKHNTNMASEK